jgi:hypothetical protein
MSVQEEYFGGGNTTIPSFDQVAQAVNDGCKYGREVVDNITNNQSPSRRYNNGANDSGVNYFESGGTRQRPQQTQNVQYHTPDLTRYGWGTGMENRANGVRVNENAGIYLESYGSCRTGGQIRRSGSYGVANVSQKILCPDEIIPYSELIMNNYEYQNPGILDHPFVGIKIRLTDYDACKTVPQTRMMFLEHNIRQVINNTGCMLRETHPTQSMDGLFLTTLPVPINQLADMNCNQIERMLHVLDLIDRKFNIGIDTQTPSNIPKIYLEINVSGYCPFNELQNRFSQIRIPSQYEQMFVPQESIYRIGKVIPINNKYILLRTQWELPFYNDNLGRNYENIKRMILDVTSALSEAFKCYY